MQRSSTVRALMLAATAALAAAVPASAVTTVTTVNGANWQIHDIAPPKLDTGSIRAISDNAFYGFGGIRVRVSGIPATDPSARLNGELMRGFGLDLRRRGRVQRRTRRSCSAASRSAATSSSPSPATGRAGSTRSPTRRSARSRSTSPSAAARARTAAATRASSRPPPAATPLIGGDDTWVQAANPAANGASSRGPHAAVHRHAARRRQLPARPVRQPAARHRPGGQLLRLQEHAHARPGADEVAAALRRRGPRRDRRHRGRAEQRRQGRRDRAGRPRPTWPASRRASAARWRTSRSSTPPPAPRAPLPGPGRGRAQARRSRPRATTSSTSRSRSSAADMQSGLTTSQAITRAYLDRIAAYDSGPFGFHSFITVAERRDGAGQGRRRRPRRRQHERPARHPGRSSRTSTTPRTCRPPTAALALEGWRPKRDAFQVKQAARGRRGDPRQGQPVRVRQLRLLQRVRLRDGLERVQAVEDVARLLRRLRGRRRRLAWPASAWARRPASRSTRPRPARAW